MGNSYEQTPFASLISLILVMSGSGIMCGTNFEALKRVDSFFEDRFYPIPQPQSFQTFSIALCVLTMVFGVFNVILGALTTGDTRRKIYVDQHCISCGQRSSRCLMIISYFMTFLWLIVFITLTVPVTLWIMLHVVCREETSFWRSISANKDERAFTYTFNLTNYGLYRRPLDMSLWTEYINSPSGFTHLCQQISTVGPLFACALLASVLVLIGLNTFVACLSTSIEKLRYFTEIDHDRSVVNNSSSRTCPTASMDYSLHPLLRTPMPNSSHFPNSSDASYPITHTNSSGINASQFSTHPHYFAQSLRHSKYSQQNVCY